MDPHLTRLRQEIESVLASLSSQQLSEWSTPEILEHLYLRCSGTPKGFAPALDAGKTVRSKLTSGNLPKITEMDEFLSECAAQSGGRLQVLDHPFLGPLSIDQGRKFHLVRGFDHVKQIRRLRSAMSQAGFEPVARPKDRTSTGVPVLAARQLIY